MGKIWGATYEGCTCPSTTPEEGTSGCSAPSISEVVVELQMSGDQLGFSSSYGNTPYCADYAIYQSNNKWVCTAPYCDSGKYLGQLYGSLICLDNTSNGHTVDSNGWITACSSYNTNRNILALKLVGSYYFTSCHTVDTIEAALTIPS